MDRDVIFWPSFAQKSVVDRPIHERSVCEGAGLVPAEGDNDQNNRWTQPKKPASPCQKDTGDGRAETVMFS